MSCRLQFSLRTLLFVAVMVCLAVGTVKEQPHDDFVSTLLGLLRILLCIVLPRPEQVKQTGDQCLEILLRPI